MAGTVSTSQMTKVQFSLPEFFDDRLIEWDVHLATSLGSYDMIIGRDILTDLGIDIHFSTQTCTWEHSTIPMRSTSATLEQSYVVAESGPVKEATTRLKKILDAKYEPIKISQVIKSSKHLISNQQDKLENLLQKYKSMFDGSLGHWKAKSVNIELKKRCSALSCSSISSAPCT